MTVIVHYPTSYEGKENLCIKVAEIYSGFVKTYISDLKCSKEQKIKLIDEVINSKKIVHNA